MRRARAIGACALLAASAAHAQWHTGLSLAGAEFGDYALPGVYGYHYTYPGPAEVDYYVAKGCDLFRIPFRWERLQHALGAPLDADELARLDAIVGYVTASGAHAILDPHNYARWHGDPVGSAAVPEAAFADFWSRLAAHFGGDPNVVFGLMNEPHDMPTEQWVGAANAALAAIRDAGAANLVLVPGNGWGSAGGWFDTWYGTPNATAMHGIVDPADHFAFEVHQYLDADASGTTPGIVSPTVGSERLAGFTGWLREHGHRGLLGEFAVAAETLGDGPAQIGDEALEDLLGHLEANADVWLGWSWWAGGPWWGEYMFTLEPTGLGQPNQSDRPQMARLEPHLLPEPSAALWPGAALAGWLSRRRGRVRDGAPRARRARARAARRWSAPARS